MVVFCLCVHYVDDEGSHPGWHRKKYFVVLLCACIHLKRGSHVLHGAILCKGVWSLTQAEWGRLSFTIVIKVEHPIEYPACREVELSLSKVHAA